MRSEQTNTLGRTLSSDELETVNGGLVAPRSNALLRDVVFTKEVQSLLATAKTRRPTFEILVKPSRPVIQDLRELLA